MTGNLFSAVLGPGTGAGTLVCGNLTPCSARISPINLGAVLGAALSSGWSCIAGRGGGGGLAPRRISNRFPLCSCEGGCAGWGGLKVSMVNIVRLDIFAAAELSF